MFTKNLNAYLAMVGWLKKDLAHATGICPESISRWNKTDKYRPGRESLEKIKSALNKELKKQGKPVEVTIDRLIADD